MKIITMTKGNKIIKIAKQTDKIVCVAVSTGNSPLTDSVTTHYGTVNGAVKYYENKGFVVC